MVTRPNVREFPGQKAREVIAKNFEFLDITTQDPEIMPVVIKKGKGVVIEDVDGNIFYDFGSGFAVLNLGHSHPKILQAIREQSEKFVHFPLYDFFYEVAVNVAEKIAKTVKSETGKKVLFANSGAEANEVMMKLVKYATKRKRFIAFYNSFHGRTQGTLSLTASKWVQQDGFFPTVPGIVHVPYPNPYRNPWHIDGYEHPDELTNRTIEFIEEYVFRHVPPEEIGAIVFEPIQGEGGYVVPPRNFFKQLKKLADKYGILLADDEVQMGVGRTGAFWAIEHFDIVPDIIQFGKAIGGGLPLSGIVHRDDISFDKPGRHSSTFAGNALALSAASVVIDEVKKLLPEVKQKGEYLGKRLNEIKEKTEIVGDVRGIGLAYGIEIVKDKKTKEKGIELRNNIIKESAKRGLIVIGCGDNSIRIIPPLIASTEEIEIGLNILEETILYIEKNRK